MEKTPPQTMQELGNDFYALMGNCISGWATVEHYLFKVCRSSLGAPTHRAAIVYSRTPTIESRRALTDELVRTVLPPKDRPDGGKDHPDVKEWSAICAEMMELLKVRNRIAHQPMGPQIEWEDVEGGDKIGKRELWFEIYASEHEETRKGKRPEGLRKEDLEAHATAVWQLKERLAAFYINRLSKHVRLLP